MQWGQITKVGHDDVFKMHQAQSRPYEQEDSVHISVTFEFNLDKTYIDRQAYSILDWLGDIGGITEAFFFIGAAFLGVVEYGKLDQMLIQDLYRAKTQAKDEEKASKTSSEKIKNVLSIQLLVHAFCPCLGRGPRSVRILTKGKQRLYDEIDIIQFMKKFRECQYGLNGL